MVELLKCVMAFILVAGLICFCERIFAAGTCALFLRFDRVGVFYCLAGKTLVKEVRAVFELWIAAWKKP